MFLNIYKIIHIWKNEWIIKACWVQSEQESQRICMVDLEMKIMGRVSKLKLKLSETIDRDREMHSQDDLQSIVHWSSIKSCEEKYGVFVKT